MHLSMRQDFRAPAFGPASASAIYSTALEQLRWAEQHGFDLAATSEHHGVDDGWMPAPLAIAGVILGATKRINVFVSAALVTLHDPVRLAEQIAVLNLASGNRLWVVAGAGYRDEEFAMAGVPRSERGKVLEDHVRVMLKAWTGEPFEWQGRTILVTPVPERTPTLFMGGGAVAPARRAARLHLPLFPMHADQAVLDAYYDEAKKVGFDAPFAMPPAGPTFVHVTEDPDKTWAEIGPYVLYEAQTYAGFQPEGQHSLPTVKASDIDDLKASPQILVGTPDDVVAKAEELGRRASFTFNPLAGGLPPELAWANLELFAAKVLPRIKPEWNQEATA